MGTAVGTNETEFDTLADLLRWCSEAPQGTRIDVSMLAGFLARVADEAPVAEPIEPPPWTWRERLWTAPAETRLGREELLEALGRSESWLYRHTGAAANDPIPHRKLEGSLVFRVGEVRAWVRDQEDVIVGGPMESTLEERRVHVAAM